VHTPVCEYFEETFPPCLVTADLQGAVNLTYPKKAGINDEKVDTISNLHG
jgi:hypothetical protein